MTILAAVVAYALCGIVATTLVVRQRPEQFTKNGEFLLAPASIVFLFWFVPAIVAAFYLLTLPARKAWRSQLASNQSPNKKE